MSTRGKRLFASLASTLFLLVRAFAQEGDVDLTAVDAYVRRGFVFEWTFYEPEKGDSAWTRVPANPGRRAIKIRDLDLPGSKPVNVFRFFPNKPERFCVIIPFDAGPDLVGSSTGLGLYLAQIGQNWDIYLNGSIIHTDSYIDKNGRISRDRSVRGALINVDRRYLKPGKNILAFQIVGDPDDERTGLNTDSPYRFGDYQGLLRYKAEYVDLMLIGIYFFFGLYHVLLYALRRKNLSYLLYGIGTFLLSVYFGTRTLIVYDFFADASQAKSLELVSLFLVLPVFLAFFDALARGRVSLFTRVYGALCGFMAICVPFFWGEPFLRAWQYSVPVPFGYLIVYDLALPIGAALAARLRAEAAAPAHLRVLRALRSGFVETDEGKLLFGVLVIAGTIGFDIVMANSGSPIAVTKYGFLVLVFGTASILASQFNRVYREVEDFNAGLEGKVRSRTAELDAALAVQSGLTGRLSESHDRLRAVLDVAARDMRIAVQVQQGFFPKKPPAAPAWDSAFVFMPASGVSGDFYDFYQDGDRLKGLALGDVSGHGVASGLVTVLSKSVFLRYFRELEGESLGKIMDAVSDELRHELAAVDTHITAVLLRFTDSAVEYVNAAHPDIAFRRNGVARANLVRSPDPKLKAPALGREGGDAPIRAMKFSLARGDSLLIYTDFLTTAPDDEGKPFGVEGMLDAYGRAPEGSAAEMLQFIMEEWRFHRHGAPQTDDFTAILIRRN